MKKVLFSILALVLALGLAVPMATSVGASPGAGLVGQWHLDEGSGKTAYDSSGLGNDGTLSGGRFGGALSFDGSNDFVDCGAAVDDSITTNVTLEAWIKPTVKQKGGIISNDLTFSPESREGYDLFLWYDQNPPTYRDLGHGTLFIDFGNGSDLGRTWWAIPSSDWYGHWHHVAATYNGSAVILYVDNSEVSSNALSGHYSSPTKNTLIGGINYGTSLPYCSFDGLIDEVRISDVARTSFDLTSAPSADDNTVALWHFNEGSGQTAGDATTANDGANDGQLGSTAYVDANDPAWVPAGPTWTTGMFDGALNFDGIDDIVTIPHSTSLNLDTAITVEVWIYADTLGNQNGIIRKGLYLTEVTKSWGLDIQSIDGVKKARFFIYDEETYHIAYSADVSTDAWHHLVGTYNGSTIDIYLDGSNASSIQAEHIGDIDTNTEDIVIGKRDGGLFFDGIIDEVHIWDVALTPDAVSWLPPVSNDDFVLKDGTTLPLKFQIFDGDVLVTSPQWVSVEISGPDGFEIKTYMLGDGVGNLMWNADGAYYIANLKTKVGTWPTGTYTATVEGIVTDTIDFELSADEGVNRGNSGN
ncbi:MAG: LamG domain-containing protein [Dehalococcoidia bacterium]|nr:MAG: LamG domain-containing protein [Dehalococcoidia bacterium]